MALKYDGTYYCISMNVLIIANLPNSNDTP